MTVSGIAAFYIAFVAFVSGFIVGGFCAYRATQFFRKYG